MRDPLELSSGGTIPVAARRTDATKPTLSFEEVTYSYGRRKPLRRDRHPVFASFSWRMPSGCTVLLGPNGAGKTTLLSLGASALGPSRGTVSLGSLRTSVRSDRAPLRRAIGWLPQHMRPVPGLTCREQVAYAGWLKGMSRSTAWRDAIEALARVDLEAEGERQTSQLSGGQQRRVGLAQMLVHRAELLLLDEPTVGLDPGQRARFRELLLDIGQHIPILVSTHQVDDLSDLFDTVVVLDRGTVRFEGTVQSFLALAPAHSAYQAEAAYATLIGGEV
jgi:ABC-2 type transport system ATP-binding protein